MTRKNDDPSVSLRATLEDVESWELEQSRVDIRTARDRLGRFTLGEFTEAIYGEDYAVLIRKQLGKKLFETRMSDISVDVDVKDGGISTKLSKELREEIEAREKGNPVSKSDFTKALDKVATGDSAKVLKHLQSMSDTERNAVFKLLNGMNEED